MDRHAGQTDTKSGTQYYGMTHLYRPWSTVQEIISFQKMPKDVSTGDLEQLSNWEEIIMTEN